MAGVEFGGTSSDARWLYLRTGSVYLSSLSRGWRILFRWRGEARRKEEKQWRRPLSNSKVQVQVVAALVRVVSLGRWGRGRGNTVGSAREWKKVEAETAV